MREWLRQNVSQEVGNSTRIIYGGPITETNTQTLIKLKDVDGFMIGNTSTKPAFRNIFDLVNLQVTRDFSFREPTADKSQE